MWMKRVFGIGLVGFDRVMMRIQKEGRFAIVPEFVLGEHPYASCFDASTIRKKGERHIVMLCPFHKEKTPHKPLLPKNHPTDSLTENSVFLQNTARNPTHSENNRCFNNDLRGGFVARKL